jgi:colanic acid biosynthesis glycosyl transferase WcaI
MNILFIAQWYAPEDVSTAILTTELAEDLVRRGHQVTMVTGAPNYPKGILYPGYRNAIYQVEWKEGVRVVRVWSHLTPSKGFVSRMLHYTTFSATAFYGGLFAGKPDVLVSYTPPLFLGISAWLLAKLWGIPWVLQIEDLFPDAVVSLGLLQNRPAIRMSYALERFLYRRAARISIISNSFRQKLLEKGVPDEKMTLIPVWADPSQVYPQPKHNDFRTQYGLDDKFVVMYAGNIGLTSSLEDVVGAAEMLKDDPGIQFVLVGEGAKKAALQVEARSKGLNNMLFLPFQPRDKYNEVLAAADVGLVTINPRSSESSLPSKVFNIMASGRPIVSVSPPESDLAAVVSSGECGINIPPEQPEQLAGAIRGMLGQEPGLEKMGQNGRRKLETNYTRERCIQQHEQMLLDVIKQHLRR